MLVQQKNRNVEKTTSHQDADQSTVYCNIKSPIVGVLVAYLVEPPVTRFDEVFGLFFFSFVLLLDYLPKLNYGFKLIF